LLNTEYGLFEGNSWEALCQLVFKTRYVDEGYTPVPDTGGDCGLEGFTTDSGCAFQCYCPEDNYASDLMSQYQRSKMTRDLRKLRDNETEIAKLIGPTKLKKWHLVTPLIANKQLIEHARKKEKQVRGWGLSITAPDFQVLVHDAGYYHQEIQQIKLAKGESLDLGGLSDALPLIQHTPEVQELNIRRKSEARLQAKKALLAHSRLLSELEAETRKHFLEFDGRMRDISRQFPALHTRLMQLINEYVHEVRDWSKTAGDPNALTEKVREGLRERIVKEFRGQVTETHAAQLARVTIAFWLASCDLDYE
jgi:hypothetical protein